MSEYSGVRIGKLKLKGEKKHKKHKKSKRSREEDEEGSVDLADAGEHGDWFKISKFEQITGSVAIEFGAHQYVRALDNGMLILGAPHSRGEAPDQEEVFVAIRVSTTHVALKSGYNKYLTLDGRNRIVGHSDAVGHKEQIEPVFQDGKLALLASNGRFISVDEDNSDLPYIIAKSQKAGDGEMLTLRTNINPEMTRIERLQSEIPNEERGSLGDCELNYVKKYQSFQDKRIRLNEEDKSNLKKAKESGRLHEELLDRRSKMKSDKFCK